MSDRSTFHPPAPVVGAPSQSRRECPLCHGAVNHIPRRWIDRVISLVMPVSRYRCTTLRCQWEGNLRGKHTPSLHVGRAYRIEGRGPHL